MDTNIAITKNNHGLPAGQMTRERLVHDGMVQTDARPLTIIYWWTNNSREVRSAPYLSYRKQVLTYKLGPTLIS